MLNLITAAHSNNAVSVLTIQPKTLLSHVLGRCWKFFLVIDTVFALNELLVSNSSLFFHSSVSFIPSSHPICPPTQIPNVITVPWLLILFYSSFSGIWPISRSLPGWGPVFFVIASPRNNGITPKEIFQFLTQLQKSNQWLDKLLNTIY